MAGHLPVGSGTLSAGHGVSLPRSETITFNEMLAELQDPKRHPITAGRFTVQAAADVFFNVEVVRRAFQRMVNASNIPADLSRNSVQFVHGRDFRIPRVILEPWLRGRIMVAQNWTAHPNLSSYQKRIFERDVALNELAEAQDQIDTLGGERLARVAEIEQLRALATRSREQEAQLAALMGSHAGQKALIAELREEIHRLQEQLSGHSHCNS